jgi:DNA invertase Pin-like site-specific DNA recombinase/prefoldin subunit 5
MSRDKAMGYVRVSTSVQVDGESLDLQRKEIEAKAQSEGFDLLEIVADEGLSGAKNDRPGLLRVMDSAKKGLIEQVIVARLSRFGRSGADVLHRIEELQRYGVGFISCKEKFDLSTPAGRMMLGLLAIISEFEREVIREQMLEGRNAKWKRRETFQGHPPYGWVWNKEKRCLELHPEQSKILKEIVLLYLDHQMPLKKIAARLKQQGVIGSRGAIPKTAHISAWIKDPILYGQYITNTSKPESEWITYDAPPIISKADYDRIQAQTSRNKLKVGRPCKDLVDRWAANILVCAECGGKIKPKVGNIRKDGSRPAYYSCYWASASESKRLEEGMFQCPLPVMKAEDVEKELLEVILFRLTFSRKSRDDLQEQLRGRIGTLEEQLKPIGEQVKGLGREKGKYEKAIKRLRQALLTSEDDFSIDEFSRTIREYGDAIKSLDSKIFELTEQSETLRRQHQESDKFDAWLENATRLAMDVRKRIKSLSPQELQEFVEGIVENRIPVSYENTSSGNVWTFLGPNEMVPCGALTWKAKVPTSKESADNKGRKPKWTVPYVERRDAPLKIQPWGLRYNPEILDKVFGLKKGTLKAHRAAALDLRRGPGSDARLLRGGRTLARRLAHHRQALSLAAPHHLRRRAHRRRVSFSEISATFQK